MSANDFSRSLPLIPDVQALQTLCDKSVWLRALLSEWRPAGHRHSTAKELQHRIEPTARPLRLAIRRHYVNFYIGGQSVAKVGFSRRAGLRAEVHVKYLGKPATGRLYETLKPADDLHISDVIAAARKWMGPEKRFVDDILGYSANANVIDIELGLPANQGMYELEDKKTAPRIDIVCLEHREDGWWVVFWEAKIASNPELRSRADQPKVVTQIERYRRWLDFGDHKKRLVEGYTEACRNLKIFHDVIKPVEALGEGILEVASGKAKIAGIDPQVRLVVQTGTDLSTPGQESRLDYYGPDRKFPIPMKRIDYRLENPNFALVARNERLTPYRNGGLPPRPNTRK